MKRRLSSGDQKEIVGVHMRATGPHMRAASVGAATAIVIAWWLALLNVRLSALITAIRLQPALALRPHDVIEPLVVGREGAAVAADQPVMACLPPRQPAPAVHPARSQQEHEALTADHAAPPSNQFCVRQT